MKTIPTMLIIMLLIIVLLLTGCSTTQKIKSRANCLDLCESHSMDYKGCPSISPFFGKYTCECTCSIPVGESNGKEEEIKLSSLLGCKEIRVIYTDSTFESCSSPDCMDKFEDMFNNRGKYRNISNWQCNQQPFGG